MTNHDSADVVSLDIIVATKDRPADLARLLLTLADQTHPDFKCVIVDQSEDIALNAHLITSLADHRFVHIVDGQRGKSKGLNLAIRSTQADIVAFTDDDCTVAPDWIETILTTFARFSDPHVLFGDVTAAPHDQAQFFVPTIELRERLLSSPIVSSPGLLGMGANMVVSRRVFDSIGGFDEDLGPGGPLFTGEDCEFAYRALRCGFSVEMKPSFSLVHWGARSTSGDIARNLVTISFFAIGAGYGKHLRSGDWRAGLVISHELFVGISEAVSNLVRWKRPFGLRRNVFFVRGVIEGLRRGPHHPQFPRHASEAPGT